MGGGVLFYWPLGICFTGHGRPVLERWSPVSLAMRAHEMTVARQPTAYRQLGKVELDAEAGIDTI